MGIALIAAGPIGTLTAQALYRGRWCECHQCWPDPLIFPDTAELVGSTPRALLLGSDANSVLRLSMLAGDGVLLALFAGCVGSRAIGWMRRVHEQIPPPSRACPLCSYPMENLERRVCPECGAHVADGSETLALRARLRAGLGSGPERPAGMQLGAEVEEVREAGSVRGPSERTEVSARPAPARVRCAVCRLEYEPAAAPSGDAGELDQEFGGRAPRCPRCHSAATVPTEGSGRGPISGA